jgi:hypothetical protein
MLSDARLRALGSTRRRAGPADAIKSNTCKSFSRNIDALARVFLKILEEPMAATKTTTSKSKSTKSTKAAKPRRTRRTGRRDPLAVRLLKQDHREVEGWFDEYEQLEEESEKLELFTKIATALKVHTQIEEEIFYPEERGEVEDDMLDEAYVEHDGAKKLIAEIEAMQPGDEFYDAKVKVLGEYIKHHVKEEEQAGGIFSQAKKGEEDLDEMGERIKARKEELMTEMGAAPAAKNGKKH